MQEQRRFIRIVIKSMDVKCKMHFDSVVELLDISFNGACISLNKQLDIGRECELHFVSNTKTIFVKGVVIWEKISKLKRDKQRGSKCPMYEVGVRFKDVLADRGIELLDFIDKNVFLKKHGLRLRGVRVRIIPSKTSTILSDHRGYTVVDLGLGGLLIETDQQIGLENKFRMEICIPKLKEPIKFLGRMVSCIEIPGTIPRLYGMGIEFIKISEKNKSRLNQFINSLQNV